MGADQPLETPLSTDAAALKLNTVVNSPVDEKRPIAFSTTPSLTVDNSGSDRSESIESLSMRPSATAGETFELPRQGTAKLDTLPNDVDRAVLSRDAVKLIDKNSSNPALSKSADEATIQAGSIQPELDTIVARDAPTPPRTPHHPLPSSPTATTQLTREVHPIVDGTIKSDDSLDLTLDLPEEKRIRYRFEFESQQYRSTIVVDRYTPVDAIRREVTQDLNIGFEQSKSEDRSDSNRYPQEHQSRSSISHHKPTSDEHTTQEKDYEIRNHSRKLESLQR